MEEVSMLPPKQRLGRRMERAVTMHPRGLVVQEQRSAMNLVMSNAHEIAQSSNNPLLF